MPQHRKSRLIALSAALTTVVVCTPAWTSATAFAEGVSALGRSCPVMTTPAPTATPLLHPRHVAGPFGIHALSTRGSTIAMTVDTSLAVLDATSGDLRQVSVTAADVSRPSLALDSYGNSYVIRYPSDITKLGPDGTAVWTVHAQQALNAVTVVGSARNEHVVVTRTQGDGFSMTLDGVPGADVPVTGDFFSSTPDGGTIGVSDGRYLHEYHADGSAGLTVGNATGSNAVDTAGSPLSLYQPGGAARLADGRLIVSDSKHGLMLLDQHGLLLGAVPPAIIDPAGLAERAAVAVVGDQVFVVSGQKFSSHQYLTQVSLSELLAAMRPMAPADRRLGFGAGIVMPVKDGYFPASATPSVKLYFDPWWQSSASAFSVCWTVRTAADLRHDLPGTSGTAPLSGVADQTGGFSIPNLPSQAGFYQVDAVLVEAQAAVAATRAYFSVGAQGQRLDLDSLPAGAGWGGAAPARGVALASALGTGLERSQLDWHNLLSQGADKALDFSKYDAAFTAASLQEQKTGTTFAVQIGQGGPERALVDSGTWGNRVREVAQHFKGTVHVWEVWNEPNNTYGDAASYVKNVLTPAYQAIKTVDPTATVVGGSTVNVDVHYWTVMKQAGALNVLDVASVHPYTGHNRSLEEQGTISQLRELQSLLTRADGSRVPLWDTESAWWSDGPANLLGQADNSARMMLWMRALDIRKWGYFLSEGGWGNSGVSFSAIQVGSYVKPAALALMTADQQLQGRPFLGAVDLGLPATYAMRFGARPGESNSGELLAAWTDGVTLPLAMKADGDGVATTLTTEFGGARAGIAGSTAQTVEVGSAPIYLSLKGPGRLSLSPLESEGADVLLASTGATVTASSATSSNAASKAIDGVDGAAGSGDLGGVPAWSSAPGDAAPELQVHLVSPTMIDRVVVGTHSIGSVITGLRDYDVEVRSATDTPWQVIASVRGQFYDRSHIAAFPQQIVAEVRVRVLAVNYSGYMDAGARPAWWPTDNASLARASDPWYGPAIITELAAYAPAAKLDGLPAFGSQTAVATPSPTASSPAPQPAATSSPTASGPAPQAAVMSLTAPTSMAAGSVARMRGLIHMTGGRPLPSVRIRLQSRRHGSHDAWRTMAVIRTSDNGSYSLSIRPTRSIDVVARYAGSSTVAAAVTRVTTVNVTRSSQSRR